MTILQLTTQFVGQVGVEPRLVRLLSTSTLSQIVAANYINNNTDSTISLLPTDFIFAVCSNGFGVFNPSFDGSSITLVPISIISAPLDIPGDIQAGLSSGTAGSLISMPGTAGTGSLALAAVENSGDYANKISNASTAQATTWILADPGGASSKVAQAPAALVAGNLVKASGTAGLLVDAGARLISSTTGAYGGGGTTNTFTATGLTSAAKGSAVIRTSTNSVSITKALPGTDSLAITFSSDPGAGTTVDYIYTSASQA